MQGGEESSRESTVNNCQEGKDGVSMKEEQGAVRKEE